MNEEQILSQIEPQVAEMELFDFHTHLVGGKLSARGLHDVLLYHMAISELYSAGCPSGHRLTEYPGWPEQKEAHARLKEAIPFLSKTINTSIAWGGRMILSDLYDWHEPVTLENFEKIDAIIRERADDRGWHRELAKKSHIAHAVTETNRREEGLDDDFLYYSVEWAFFTRTQWGEYDTALYELERTWGQPATGPTPIGGKNRPALERAIRNAEDVRDAVRWYVTHFPETRLVSYATPWSMDIDYSLVTPEEFESALKNREHAGEKERSIYAAYINEVLLEEFGKAHGKRIIFQPSICADPLPFESCSRISQRTLSQFADIIARHPQIRFTFLAASAHANQTLCTFVRELPNLALCGYWWHNFFPTYIEKVISERLDMLPLNRQLGFFSDAYCLEWAYAKAKMVKSALCQVLAAKVKSKQFNIETALHIAKTILYDSAKAWSDNTEF
ncbi:MAG: hypothetical protein FWD31_02340 [Planctomycetaceae bacterium]|nr:hypothetical protein [Planctomycetaceae bacterium]